MAIFRTLIVLTLLSIASKAFFEWAWRVKHVFPVYLKTDSGLSLSLKCAACSTFPLALIILISIISKTFSSKGIFSQSNESALLDTIGQTLLFVINLLAASVINLSTERMMIITTIFIFGRFLDWFGFILGTYLEIYELRLPGFVITFGNTAILIVINLKRLFS